MSATQQFLNRGQQQSQVFAQEISDERAKRFRESLIRAEQARQDELNRERNSGGLLGGLLGAIGGAAVGALIPGGNVLMGAFTGGLGGVQGGAQTGDAFLGGLQGTLGAGADLASRQLASAAQDLSLGQQTAQDLVTSGKYSTESVANALSGGANLREILRRANQLAPDITKEKFDLAGKYAPYATPQSINSFLSQPKVDLGLIEMNPPERNTKEAFDQAMKLRDAIINEKPMQNYAAVNTTAAKVAAAWDDYKRNPAGSKKGPLDVLLVKAWNNVIEPTSVTQGGEFRAIVLGQGLPHYTQGFIDRLQSGGAGLDEEGRKALVNAIAIVQKQSKTLIQPIIDDYINQARLFNLPEKFVIPDYNKIVLSPQQFEKLINNSPTTNFVVGPGGKVIPRMRQ